MDPGTVRWLQTRPTGKTYMTGKLSGGRASSNVKHNLTSYAVYELPVGKGKAIGNNWNSVVRNIVGNWAVSGILTLRGGFASTIGGPDASGTNSRGPRANRNGPVNIYGTGTNSPLEVSNISIRRRSLPPHPASLALAGTVRYMVRV